MTVKELIKFLEKQPLNMSVGYKCHSEQCLLEANEIEIKSCCKQRTDGWLQDERPDMPSREYLIFPGN